MTVTINLAYICYIPLLHAQHAVSKLLTELRVDTLINPHGVEHEAYGQQGVHLVIHLRDLQNNTVKERFRSESLGV